MKRIFKCLFAVLMSVICITSCKDKSTYEPPYANVERLSRITGVELPEYTVISDSLVWRNWMGDSESIMIIEFKEQPSEAFYASLDSMVVSDSQYWSTMNNGASWWFHRSWGNVYPAPEGEDPKYDNYIQVEIPREGKTVKVTYGMW